jgi:hypothetical protein
LLNSIKWQVISEWQFGKDVESGGHDIIWSPIQQLPRGTEETHRWPPVHIPVSKTTYGCDLKSCILCEFQKLKMLSGIFESNKSEYCKKGQNYTRSFIICSGHSFATVRMRTSIYVGNETYIKDDSTRACNKYLWYSYINKYEKNKLYYK